jgi:uncharacterized protein (TIRG00374 family)
MKFFVNLLLSCTVLAVCVYLVWPGPQQKIDLTAALAAIRLDEFWPYLAGSIALLAATHFCRTWRWNYLLAPIGAKLRFTELLAYSSIGFMAILALPFRLGELARPALVRRHGISAAAVLGTVAVERIVDGLMVSLLVFVCFVARRGPDAPPWMMSVAFVSLGVFVAAMTFLGFAMRWPDRTISICMNISLLPRLAPKLAFKIEELIRDIISGLTVLGDKRNLVIFVLWSVVYWVVNALSMWVLARGMHLPLSITGAFATMGLLAVGITLPNAPGFAGQFEVFTTLGLAVYLPTAVAKTVGLAYALVLHGIQVVWYIGLGAIFMLVTRVRLGDLIGKKAIENPPAPVGDKETAA